MSLEAIYVILGISILSSISCKNSTVGMIKKIGVPRVYKGYIAPAKWMKTIFNIKQRLIPRYLYFELILSLFFATLGPVNLIISAIANYSPFVMGILVMFHCCLIIFNAIYFVIMSSWYKK